MVGANTTSVYPCHSCEIPRAHVRANTEKMRDCHLVARTCDNEVGVVISIRDPYTSRRSRAAYLPTIQGFPGLSRDLGSDPGIQGFLQ